MIGAAGRPSAASKRWPLPLSGTGTTLWAPLVNAAPDLWLIVSTIANGLFDPVAAPVPPALGHEVPPRLE